MRFLVDESTGPAVAHWLREEKHEVFSIYEKSRGMDDDEVIQKCLQGGHGDPKDKVILLRNWT